MVGCDDSMKIKFWEVRTLPSLPRSSREAQSRFSGCHLELLWMNTCSEMGSCTTEALLTSRGYQTEGGSPLSEVPGRRIEALVTAYSVLVGRNVRDLHPIAAIFQQACVIKRNE